MARLITALKFQKRDGNRVCVYLDHEYAFSVSLMDAAGLQKGSPISPSRIRQLQDADRRYKAYHAAIRLLAHRPRSHLEIKRYLDQKGYLPDVIADTLRRLRHEKVLDDRKFALNWLENRQRFSPRSAFALRYELKEKGICADVIDSVLADFDETRSAWTAVKGKLGQWKALRRQEFRHKVVTLLSRRGFDYDTCREVFHRAWSLLNSNAGDGFEDEP